MTDPTPESAAAHVSPDPATEWQRIAEGLSGFGWRAAAAVVLEAGRAGALDPATVSQAADIAVALAGATRPPGDLIPADFTAEGWGSKMAIGAPATPPPIDIPGNIPGSQDTALTEERLAVTAENATLVPSILELQKVAPATCTAPLLSLWSVLDMLSHGISIETVKAGIRDNLRRHIVDLRAQPVSCLEPFSSPGGCDKKLRQHTLATIEPGGRA